MTTQLTRAARAGSPRLSVTARAVRAALFASTAAVAIVATPAAFAQSCVQTALPNTVTCTGPFTTDVYGSVPLANQMPNLTLILDDATTVDPLAGVNGLTAAWGGDVTVISDANIDVTGADGIQMYGSSTATLDSYGDVSSEVTALGNNAIDVSAFGDADVVLGGNVYAYNEAAVDVVTTTISSLNGDSSLLLGDGGYVGAYAFDGDATAAYLEAYDSTSAIVDGDIAATSINGGATGLSSTTVNLDSSLFNDGSISAEGYGFATAADFNAGSSLYVYNNGSIDATAHGDTAVATGVEGTATTAGIHIDNEDSIGATSDYTAIGLNLSSNSYVDLYNYGSITADGGTNSIAIDTSGGASTDYIYNAGTITGAIYTGTGDDYLYNEVGATWNAMGYSDFGAGDDTIVNQGTITLDDSGIYLGDYATAGNFFTNSGTLSVNGYSYVDVGLGTGSLFTNNDTIDMQDGAADDALAIFGNFAGTGDINVDVDGSIGSTGAADTLYIDGNVAANADQTINVDLVDLSPGLAGVIPIVGVSGTSVAGNFSLGTVSGFSADDSFVNLDFNLVSDIDTTNATPDVFSLGITVTGLSDAGTVMANLPGSVQRLMNAQVGTWRQRMGVIDHFNDGAVALWARVWGDKGSFSPEHHALDFGDGGNFDFDQKDRGVEAGVDFAVTDEFSIGLLFGKSKAEMEINDTDTGNDIDADTWGIYGTWISPEGFYLDASYRWMSFDVDMDALIGERKFDSKAESFNVELGYAWTLSGGLKIEPQFQYTKTNVHDFDVLTTDSGMTFRSDGGDSSRGRLGVAVRKTFDSGSDWTWTPYAALSAVREFDGESVYVINGALHGSTDMSGTSGLLELGFTANHGNWAVYGGLNWEDGGAVDNFFGGQLGVRYTFGGAAPAPTPPPVVAAPAKTCADLDDDSDGVNNCNDKCASAAGETVGADGCPVPAPQPEMAPKPYRN